MKQTAKVQKSGAIGYLSSQDINDYEQMPNSWTYVENARMRNGGVEHIRNKLTIADDVVNISELAYMNSENGLFHVLFGDGTVGTIFGDSVYKDISHENLETNKVTDGDFETDPSVNWTYSAEVVWDTDKMHFTTVDTILVDNPDFQDAGAVIDPWEIEEKIRKIGSTYYFSPTPHVNQSTGDVSVRWLPAGHTDTTLLHYVEQELITTPGPSAGLTVILEAWTSSEGDLSPYEYTWRIELIDSLDAVIAYAEELVSDSGEYKTQTIELDVGVGDSLTDIQIVRIGVIGRVADGLRLEAGLSSVYVYEKGVYSVEASLEQNLTLTLDEDYQLLYTISDIDKRDSGENLATIQVGTQVFDITANGSFAQAIVGEATNNLEVLSDPTSIGFKIDDIEVRSGAFLPNTYPDNVWIWDKLHGVLAATNGVSDPVYLPADATPSTRIVDLPEWGKYTSSDTVDENDNDVCRTIAAYKDFLFAGNIKAGGSNSSSFLTAGKEYPSLIRWSDKSDPGQVPGNWYSADPTTLAGELDVGGEMGAILAMKTLRDDLILYGELATKRITFTGGTYIFKLTTMFPKTGIYGPRCVVEHRALHYLITQDDIVVNDGQQVQSIADGRVRKDIFTKIRQQERNSVFLALVAEKGELWVCANVDEAIGADTAWVYSLEEQTWSLRSLDSEYVVRELPKLDEIINTGEDVGHLTYEQLCELANNDCTDPALPSDDITGVGIDMYSANADQPYSVKIAALGDLEAYSGNATTYARQDAGSDADLVLQRSGLNITDDEHASMVTAVYPRMIGSCTVEVGSQETVDGDVTWSAPEVFVSGEQYRVTFKQRGRRHAVRFKGTGLRIEGYDIEWSPAGRR